MSLEELLEQLERHDVWQAQFYPLTINGHTWSHTPMDIAFALDALMKWRAHRKAGEDPSETYWRLREEVHEE